MTEMLMIRAEWAADAAAIDHVYRQACGRDDEGRLVRRIRAAADFDPALSLVAAVDGTVLGHIVFSPILIVTADEPVTVLALAPMAVLPEWQGKNVGSHLVREGLDACRKQGHQAVIVAGLPDFYRSFGFTPALARGIEASFSLSDALFMALELVPDGLAGVAGTVVYPPSFDGAEVPDMPRQCLYRSFN